MAGASDLAYLKKRAEFLGWDPAGFNDEKIAASLSKITPPNLAIDADIPENNGYECVVRNKLFRNWIDLIPDSDRGFMQFSYADGNDDSIEKYLRLAMTAPAWLAFKSYVSKDPEDKDLFLMRWLVWNWSVLGRPVGADFGNYEMNAVFCSLPVDISRGRLNMMATSFADFYMMIKFARWGLENAG